MINAVKAVVGATVPKIAVVEGRIDGRRGIARLDVPNTDTANVKDGTGPPLTGDVKCSGVVIVTKFSRKDAL